jgi:hypothetical protein
LDVIKKYVHLQDLLVQPLSDMLGVLWGHYMTLAPLRGILTDLRKMRSAKVGVLRDSHNLFFNTVWDF